MYQLNRDSAPTELEILQILRNFDTVERPKLERYNQYYLGKQDILSKRTVDPSKPCNRIVVNYCSSIANTYAGYLTSVDITYSSDKKDITNIQDILNYNDVSTEDSVYLMSALKYGVAYELNYIDEEGKQRFKVVDSRECIPVYYNDLNQDLACVIRYYPASEASAPFKYYVDVYDAHMIYHYSTTTGFGDLTIEKPEEPHYFNQIPFTVFELNEDREPVYSQIITLQDAYNNLISSEVDDFQAFCDAYLVLQGMDVDPEELSLMRENRVLVVPDGGDAQYLVKNISDTQIENMLTNINDTIYKISNCPNFSDESFGTSSGIALRHKLLGFTNIAGNIEKRMTKALRKRFELICSVLHLTGTDEDWSDINIKFTENLPIDMNDVVNIVNSLRGLVSNKTLLAQIPFVNDVDSELEQLKAEKEENMLTYGFPTQISEEDDDELLDK